MGSLWTNTYKCLNIFFSFNYTTGKKKKKKWASNQMLFLDGILSTDFC